MHQPSQRFSAGNGGRATRSYRDDREQCGRCGKLMVPRIITCNGVLERSVCPFCGGTHRQFLRESRWPVVAFLVLFFCIFFVRCS